VAWWLCLPVSPIVLQCLVVMVNNLASCVHTWHIALPFDEALIS
jgi:hypothetical protein